MVMVVSSSSINNIINEHICLKSMERHQVLRFIGGDNSHILCDHE